jgi:cysteine-rich repeat protein
MSLKHLLSAVLVLEIGVFSGQMVFTDSALSAYLRSKIPQATKVETVKKTMRRVVIPKAATTVRKASKRTIRARVGSGATTGSVSSRVVEYEKSRCGDKLIINDEECDDGNATANDGCSAACKVETGYFCTKSQPSTCVSTCGDGIIAYNERCDDGDVSSGDGCNSGCRIEIGYTCTGTPSVCKVNGYCGNGILEGDEACDDQNQISGDGCSSSCKTE